MKNYKGELLECWIPILLSAVGGLLMLYLGYKLIYSYPEGEPLQVNYASFDISDLASTHCRMPEKEVSNEIPIVSVSILEEVEITEVNEEESVQQAVYIEPCTTEETKAVVISKSYGSVLTAYAGVNYNANGNKETWYNLNMSGVVQIMREQGFSESEYPYWVRDDGVKMLGPYVMVAANLGVYPRGSIVYTSLGEGLVCDTGEFAKYNPHQFDIAVSW